MKDTPEDVYQIQLQNWLSKSPAERLYQSIKDNDDLMTFLKISKQLINNPARDIILSETEQKTTHT